jgi:DNA-binding NtrC family response regulator
MALTYAGYDVVCVREGAAAIAAYETAKVSGHPFGAVILDLHIKDGMGGQATLAHLRAYDPDVKAILCSAAGHDPIMEHYDVYGFAARLSKPFNRSHLQQLLQHIIYNYCIEPQSIKRERKGQAACRRPKAENGSSLKGSNQKSMAAVFRSNARLGKTLSSKRTFLPTATIS